MLNTKRDLIIFQKKEELLREISETLNAPLEKLLPTTKRLFKEWKDIRRENRRLIDELAALETGKGLEQTAVTREIDDVKLVIQEFEPLNVDRMIKTANKLAKKEATAITLFYGKDGKTFTHRPLNNKRNHE